MMKHAVVSSFALASLTACSYESIDAHRTNEMQGIVNGSPTTIGEHPWQVAIEANFGFCGASIIDSEWVLTANHCVEGASAGSVSVFAGMTRLSEGAWMASGSRSYMRAEK